MALTLGCRGRFGHGLHLHRLVAVDLWLLPFLAAPREGEKEREGERDCESGEFIKKLDPNEAHQTPGLLSEQRRQIVTVIQQQLKYTLSYSCFYSNEFFK